MASQQQAMFGNFQSYAAQITPAYGAGPGMGALRPPVMGGYHTGSPPMISPPPPPMTGLGMGYGGGMMQMAMAAPYASPQMGMQQAMGEQLAGSFTGGLSTVGSGLARIGGYGAMGAAGLGMLGMGGMGMAALGGLPGMAVVGGLEAGAYGLSQMHSGFQERQNVNRVLRQRFGGMMGIGGGRGGMGFNTQEMGQVSSMVRGMADQDMFTSFDELTRLMDRTAQMGTYRGVQGAKQFQEKFKATVSSLKEIAQTMHTSLEGATQFFEQAKNQGFFSGRDISATLRQTTMAAGASGMSMDQMMAIRNQGTQMGRMMGMRGRTGAGAMMQMATNIGVGMQTGAISDELISEATGGLMGAEGAQAAAGMMMQSNARWLKRGVGRVMLAGLWDPATGGINRERLQQVMSGGMSFQDIRTLGRANISGTSGRRSEFFANEERLGGQLQEAGGGAIQFGMLEQHIQARRGVNADDPIGERFIRRQTGWSQEQFELQRAMYRNLPRILEDRAAREAQQRQSEMRTQSMEGSGVRGAQKRIQNWWQKEVTSPIRQMGDDLVTSFTTSVDSIFEKMEGTVKLAVSERTKNLLVEYARTGKRGGDLMSFQRYQQLSRKLSTTSDEGGFWGGVGRNLGLRPDTVANRIKDAAIYENIDRNASQAQKVDFLNKYSSDIQMTANDFGFTNEKMDAAKIRADQILTSRIGTGDALQRFRHQRESFGLMSSADKYAMFARRYNMYVHDPTLGPMLGKAQTRAQRFAILGAIESGMGQGISLPVGEMGGGQSYETLEARLESAGAKEKAVIDSLAGKLLGKSYGTDWAYQTTREGLNWFGTGGKDVTKKITGRELIESIRNREREYSGSGGLDPSDMMAGTNRSSSIEDRSGALRRYAGSLTTLMSNDKTRDLLIRASKEGGDPAALKELQALSRLGTDQAVKAGITDIESLGKLTQRVANNDDGIRKDIATLAEASNVTNMIAVAQRVKESGIALGESLRNNSAIGDAADAMPSKKAMAALQAIAAAESTGNWDAANELRERFYSHYIGQKGAADLAGALAADPSGGAVSLGVGMQRAIRIRGGMTGKGGTAFGVREMLGQVGLDEKALGGKAYEALGRTQKERMKKFTGMLTSEGGMTSEQLRGFLGSEEQKYGATGDRTASDVIAGMGGTRFTERTGSWLEKGKNKWDRKEVSELAVGEGAASAQAGSMGGPEARQSLAEKQYNLLDQMLKLQIRTAQGDKGLIEEQTNKLVAALGMQSKTEAPAGQGTTQQSIPGVAPGLS
jgi:hypothetical protein